jgi:hypothetical protein
MPCESCKNLDLRGQEEGFILKLADIQETCKYCSLLLSLVQHFAPNADHDKTKGMLRIDLQHCTATNVEIMSATDDYGSSDTLATLWVYRRLGTWHSSVLSISLGDGHCAQNSRCSNS